MMVGTRSKRLNEVTTWIQLFNVYSPLFMTVEPIISYLSNHLQIGIPALSEEICSYLHQ